MCRDALKEFLVFPRVLYSSQEIVYLEVSVNNICIQSAHNSILDPTFNWNTILSVTTFLFLSLV